MTSSRNASEAWLQAALRDALAEDGYRVAPEFPVLGRVADLFCVSGDATTAIECKLRDVGAAIRQARLYQHVADYVFIALPRRRSSRPSDLLLTDLGIGLIEVDEIGKCVTVVPATQGNPISLLRERAIADFTRRISAEGDAEAR